MCHLIVVFIPRAALASKCRGICQKMASRTARRMGVRRTCSRPEGGAVRTARANPSASCVCKTAKPCLRSGRVNAVMPLNTTQL